MQELGRSSGWVRLRFKRGGVQGWMFGRYAGHQAIGAWWRETKNKYQTAIEPLEADDEDGVATVRARVTGQFPGSPAMLNFMFRLDGDRISRLDIEA